MKSPRPRSSARRGVLYIQVLFTALIVAVIATTALRVFRSQSEEQRLVRDFVEAKRYAHAAAEIAMFQMQQDPDWRVNLGDGQWSSLQPLDQGRYSIMVTDQVDGNISDNWLDPVTVHALGEKGIARFKRAITVAPSPAEQTCLGVALMSGNKMDLQSSVIHTNQLIAANDSITATSSRVDTDAEANLAISGNVYSGSNNVTGSSRRMPDASNVLERYTSSGSSFTATSLPQFVAPEILPNSTFENDTAGWIGIDSTSSVQVEEGVESESCTLERTSAIVRTGGYSLLVKNRDDFRYVAAHVLEAGNSSLANFVSGHAYRLTLPVKVTAPSDVKAICEITDTSNGLHVFGEDEAWTLALQQESENNGFKTVALDFRPFFAGQVKRCVVKLVFRSRANDYYLDDASLVDLTYPAGVRVLERAVLSPSSNPYGSTNTDGIYIIDCQGQNVALGFARVSGTIVLRNPGPRSGIYGPMAWETLESGFPALLSEGSLYIAMTDVALNEADLDLNLNPAGTPAPYAGGIANSSRTDSYASQVTGLIYARENIAVEGRFSLKGVAIAQADFSFLNANVNAEYDAAYTRSPPPGFDVWAPELDILSGSWRRVVD